MGKEPSLKKNIILSTSYQILTMITPFITAPYVSRVLGSDGIGIFSYTQSYESFFLMFASLGTVAYGTREIARKRDNLKERSQFFWEIQSLKLITTILVLIAWFGFSNILSEYKAIFMIMAFNIFANIFDVSWFFAGIERFEYTVYKNTAFKILSIICIFLFVKNKSDLHIYIIINVLSTSIGHMSMWIGIRKFLAKPDLKTFKLLPHLKKTLVYFIPTIAVSIYTILDKALIGVITQNTSENGYYEQATKIINMAKSLTFVAMNQVLSSRISYLFAEKKFDEIKDRINTSIDYILFMGFGMGFGIYSIAGSFVPMFFGNGYDKVVQLLQLMSPLIIIIGISYSLSSQYFTPAGLQALSARFVIVGCFVNLVLNVIFIPKLESAGAVIASVLAETVITGLYIWHSKEFFKIINIIRLGWKKLIAGLAMLISMNAVCYLKITGLALVMLQFLVGSVVYIGVLVLLRDSIFNLIVTKVKENKRS